MNQSKGKLSELLPCPFCGSSDISLWTGFGTQAEIECNECGCDRSVQVKDVCPNATWDNKTFKHTDWTIEKINNRLGEDWNTRAALHQER